jgi:hypothetical protein
MTPPQAANNLKQLGLALHDLAEFDAARSGRGDKDADGVHFTKPLKTDENESDSKEAAGRDGKVDRFRFDAGGVVMSERPTGSFGVPAGVDAGLVPSGTLGDAALKSHKSLEPRLEDLERLSEAAVNDVRAARPVTAGEKLDNGTVWFRVPDPMQLGSAGGDVKNLAAPTAPPPPAAGPQTVAAGIVAAPGKSSHTLGYFTLEGREKGEDAAKSSKSTASVDNRAGDSKDGATLLGRAGKPAEKGKADEFVAAGQPKPTEPAPAAPASRKIIRTGELEFEIEAFDAAVAALDKLIKGIPGAFVATVNSEKLPNGKVRGSAVVRLPPDRLDQFVLDLRRDLGKTGELKSQRIGSQDVTKQYTDIESRLRAARTMEERLIAIIKSGKGEIKDLLNAERELGVWRTKIEEMEGEIRYYNNQVSLSTLTITMYEKEIRAAAALVITERVNMRIEADDVEKSLQAALAAVADAKGRITRSEMKQHTAGQFEAILEFQVNPAAAPGVRDKLKQLGIVTHQDAQRLQQAEGGTGSAAEIKSRTNDVQFHVTLYNVANIQPRETYHVQVAVENVPADYRKLQDAVAQAKGQVRSANLNEQDKLNINAQFDFDVPADQREAIDKLLAQLGDVFSRSTARAAPGETATDRKVGYRLTLRSFISIPPREAYSLQAVSLDVVGAYRKLQDAVAAAKGHMRSAQLNEQDKLKVTAQLDFDVPAAQREPIEKLLDEVGDVFSRSTSRASPNEAATDRKIGYRLTLRHAASMPPRESVKLKIEVTDVDRAATSLKDMVKASQGRVVDERVKYDANGQVTALLAFDVPLAVKDELVRKFMGVGKLRFSMPSQNPQAPETELAIANLDVMLATDVPIVPSDEGLWPQIRTGLSYSFRLLSLSVMFIILGLSVVLPWALLIWVVVRVVRRMRLRAQTAA